MQPWWGLGIVIKDHFRYLTTVEAHPGIDMLRALAVMSVVLFHFWMFPIGWIGVDLFFVISGFLIGGAIIKKKIAGSFSFKEFYWRRFLRIAPVYYAAILVTALLFYGDSSLTSTLAALTLLQTTLNYFFLLPMSLATPGGSWSLVTEEHFYILAPLTIISVNAFAGLRGVTLFAALAVLSGPFVRMYMTSGFAPDDPNWHFASFVQFHSRYDELAVGVLVACLALQTKPSRLWLQVMLFSSLLLLSFFVTQIVAGGYFFSPQSMTRDTIWVPSVLGIAFAIWVFVLRDLPLKSKAVIAIARLSYPLYLFHIAVIAAANVFPQWILFSIPHDLLGVYGQRVASIFYSFVLSYLVSLIVEFPFLRLYKPNIGKPKAAAHKGHHFSIAEDERNSGQTSETPHRWASATDPVCDAQKENSAASKLF